MTARFTHLHVHTEYSTLDGASKIPALVDKAVGNGMSAIAITDHGNMFGVKEFFNTIKKKNASYESAISDLKKELKALGEEDAEKAAELKTQIKETEAKRLKPIIGCEVYVAANSRFEKKGKENQSGYHLVILAKNETGYHNLIKLVSLGWTEGFYYKPRIDKEILEKYHEGLIIASACLGGEIPQHILHNRIEEAEKTALWFKNLLGEDFYLELQRHPTEDPNAARDIFPEQQRCNAELIKMAEKLDIKLIVTNDTHFVNEEEAEAHDRLLCISTNADVNDPKRMRYTKQEWFKTQEEMEALFHDVPHALTNTMEIADKVEFYNIDSSPIMPDFPLPEGFTDADEYLAHLSWEGAKKRWGDDLADEIRERIQFELDTIKNMGYPGYFLIVQDFIAEARRMGVSVGPGRGSAAGSVVAYCLKITMIDPIKYDLLFERFLNPDRISMPDIDIDFDDEGRAQVLKYVEEKYGKEKVAHIITFGTMATKSAIKDVARVQKLPLQEAERLTKLIPDRLPEKNGKAQKISIKSCIENVPELQLAAQSTDPLLSDTLKYAQMLEGTIRNTGVHACGVIIGRDDLMNYIPISTAYDKESDSDVLVTQYEGSVIEEVGMLKMDFLGLKTLSIIKDALVTIKEVHGIDIDIDNIPLDDPKTYELFGRGETVGTFQFESEGMRKYLKELKPTQFEDLIAMTSLYRPGPMDYIPDFIDCKHGRKPIKYDIPIMERYLKDTYGITVYQEQVMLLSRLLAGFTRGQSDELRKAMGKKMIEKMNALKQKFIEGCAANGHPKDIVIKIWEDWEKFAQYAFNKSHATCYAWVSYQTAYLKANYPSEYMAAVLSRNKDNITEITKFMDEARRMGINVLGPDVNESNLSFTVNKEGNVRFGMGAIKNVGRNAVEAIVAERRKNGLYQSIYDFVERLNLSVVNKKNIESLANSGAFDNFTGISRQQFFESNNNKGETFTDSLLRYGNKLQADKALTQNSLFGGSAAIEIAKPEIPSIVHEWSRTELLNREKELIGIYLSAHPLDTYKFEMNHFVNCTLAEMEDLKALKGRDLCLGGIVASVKRITGKTSGKEFAVLTLEDYTGSYEFRFFGKDFETYMKYFTEGYSLFIRANVEDFQRYGKKDEKREENLTVRIKSINLLSNIRDEILKSITLTIPVNELTEYMVNDITRLAQTTKGQVAFQVKLLDPEENIALELFSRNYQVGVDNAFLDVLKETGLKFQLN